MRCAHPKTMKLVLVRPSTGLRTGVIAIEARSSAFEYEHDDEYEF